MNYVEVAAVVVGIGGLGVAGWALTTSWRAIRVSEASVEAANKSATAAEDSAKTARESFDLQREQVTAGNKTNIVLHGWSGGHGLSIENLGPGAAKDIVVALAWPDRLARLEGLAVAKVWIPAPSFQAGRADDIFQDQDLPPDKGPNDEEVASALWTNPDGSRRGAEWRGVPRIAL